MCLVILGFSAGGKLIDVETKEEGEVSWGLYWGFVKSVGVLRSSIALLLCIGMTTSLVLSDWWLSEWAKGDEVEQKKTRYADIPSATRIYCTPFYYTFKCITA